MKFKEWLSLNEGSNPGGKTGLYPLGYAGIGLYPPQWYPTRSADAIFYMSIDDRVYKSKDHPKLKNLDKGGSQDKLNSGEDGLWNIKHIKGDKLTKKGSFATNNGEGGLWNIKHLKGKPSYTKNKDLIPDGGDGGIWNIKNV